MHEGLRIAASADFHIRNPEKQEFPDRFYRQIIKEASDVSDYIVLCGDVVGTIWGAERAASILTDSSVPVLVVPGNHDDDEAQEILEHAGNVIILQNATYTIQAGRRKLHIVATRGGYDGSLLKTPKNPSREQRASERAASRLSQSLAFLNSALSTIPELDAVIVATHYAPIDYYSHAFMDGSVKLGQVIDQHRNKENTIGLYAHVHHGEELLFSSSGI